MGTPAYTACNGKLDCACNTANIVAYYNFNRAAGGAVPTPLADYAAGLCSATISGYSDWYLPPICELSYDVGAGCGTSVSPLTQNVNSNLIDSGAVPITDYHWSSTQAPLSPTNAWGVHLASSGGGSVFMSSKGMSLPVRCARALTP